MEIRTVCRVSSYALICTYVLSIWCVFMIMRDFMFDFGAAVHVAIHECEQHTKSGKFSFGEKDRDRLKENVFPHRQRMNALKSLHCKRVSQSVDIKLTFTLKTLTFINF